MKAFMRRAARSLANRVGVVPRSRVDHLVQALERAQTKIAELKGAIPERQNGTAKDSAKWVRRCEKLQEELQRVRDREERHRTRIAELHEKAQSSERALRIAREQLMAVEVKLDIIEGALTVLDSRTRAALSATSGSAAPAGNFPVDVK